MWKKLKVTVDALKFTKKFLTYFGFCTWLTLKITLHKFSRCDTHCVKSVQIRSFFWSIFSRIRTEYGEIRTRKNSVFGHFSRSVNSCVIFWNYYITRSFKYVLTHFVINIAFCNKIDSFCNKIDAFYNNCRILK